MPQELQLVAFQLAQEVYGVDIAQVQEIIRMQPITKVPGAPDFVEGVINSGVGSFRSSTSAAFSPS
jgi:CheW protein